MGRVIAGPDPSPVALPDALLAEVRGAAEAAYPREACGALLGRVDDGTRRVERVEPADNRRTDRADRYLVDPGTLRRLLDEEDAGGLRILGFYHSHPDAAPRPSETDREAAWPWYVYLIVACADGRAGAVRAWELREDRTAFEEREVRVSPAIGEPAERRTADHER